jgi:hypothetical protein
MTAGMKVDRWFFAFSRTFMVSACCRLVSVGVAPATVIVTDPKPPGVHGLPPAAPGRISEGADADHSWHERTVGAILVAADRRKGIANSTTEYEGCPRSLFATHKAFH